jgi:hypothetical protein
MKRGGDTPLLRDNASDVRMNFQLRVEIWKAMWKDRFTVARIQPSGVATGG